MSSRKEKSKTYLRIEAAQIAMPRSDQDSVVLHGFQDNHSCDTCLQFRRGDVGNLLHSLRTGGFLDEEHRDLASQVLKNACDGSAHDAAIAGIILGAAVQWALVQPMDPMTFRGVKAKASASALGKKGAQIKKAQTTRKHQKVRADFNSELARGAFTKTKLVEWFAKHTEIGERTMWKIVGGKPSRSKKKFTAES